MGARVKMGLFFRSTVAFSQEVTEAKAMDDALDKISSMSASKPPEPLGK